MAASRANATSADTPASFEIALSELETIVKSLEGGQNDLALEQSLAAYQRGMALLRYCQESLNTADQKVKLLEQDALRDFTPTEEE
ncbi:MAG TPA: exodeoxyribonuclease VII small subunit [Rhodocyclaceae bacterium]|nr:exodeoxyribonuclease VII small subunit [Rhodocyclaceae bacterium]